MKQLYTAIQKLSDEELKSELNKLKTTVNFHLKKHGFERNNYYRFYVEPNFTVLE